MGGGERCKEGEKGNILYLGLTWAHTVPWQEALPRPGEPRSAQVGLQPLEKPHSSPQLYGFNKSLSTGHGDSTRRGQRRRASRRRLRSVTPPLPPGQSSPLPCSRAGHDGIPLVPGRLRAGGGGRGWLRRHGGRQLAQILGCSLCAGGRERRFPSQRRGSPCRRGER